MNQRGCAITVNQQGAGALRSRQARSDGSAGSGAVSGVVSGNSVMLGAVGYSQDGPLLRLFRPFRPSLAV